jgi:ribose 5-phosphate isomerase B
VVRGQPPRGRAGCGGVVPEIARLAREHNDADVLVLPARFVSTDEGVTILRTWLDTAFAGGRHSRRVAKIDQEPG